MGWSFACDTSFKRADQVARFRSPGFFSEGFKLLESRVVGNHFWGLIEHKDERYIFLALMQGGGRNMGWGYKDMDESAGPFHVDCPLSLLNQCTEPRNENSAKWREDVRKFHARARIKPKPGLVVKIGAHEYRLDEPYAPRRGWAATRVEDGERYRISARHLAWALKFVNVGGSP